MKETKKVPKGALRFVEPGQTACAFAEDGEEEKLQMTVYSGGVMADHWWWDNLILDLQGVKFLQKTFPILEEHRSDKKIGFHKKPNVDNEKGIWLNPNTTEFVDTPESQEFRKLSKSGFPYQSSLYGRPIKVQRFGADEEVEVNGRKVKGPGTVWREWVFKESSVCVFGWDSKTKATAFSREETEDLDFVEEGGEEGGNRFTEEDELDNPEGGENTMDMKELKEKHPDLFAQVIEEGKKAAKEEAEGAFSQERQQFQAQLDTTNQKLSETLDRTAKMEKELALAREGQLKAEADKLFAEIFADSDIEPRLEPKVRNQINHSKFVKDDKLDVEAFTKAVEDEIKDWETRLPSSGVSGFSNPNDHDDDSDSENNKKFSEENKSITNDLLSRAGQTTSEK